MDNQTINLGADVRTSDGHSIGKVKHLIIDSKRNSLAGFVADKGLLDSGRVVDIGYVTSITEDEIQLRLSEEEAEELAGFVQHEYINVSGSNDSWLQLGPTKGDVPGTGSESLFAMPLPVDARVRTEGPLEAEDIVLDKGTDVVDKIGNKIGTVDEITFSGIDQVTGFVVKQGRVFHHDVFVPMEWVAGITHEHVRLNVLKDEVEGSRAT